MIIHNTRWTQKMIAGLVIAGAAMLSIGCGSSSNSASGTGGATGTGGKTGSGGAAGGTSGGTGGATVVHVVSYTFDTTAQMWAPNAYADPSSVNLAADYADAGIDAGGGDAGTGPAKPVVEFDGTIGNPTMGSLKVTVTFTAYGQYVDPVINLATPVNLAGKALHSKLQLTSGMFSGGAQLHINAGGGYAKAPIMGITAATWVTTTLDLATVVPDTTPFDPMMVTQIGIQIFSGTAPTAGAAYPNAGMQVVFNIDTVQD